MKDDSPKKPEDFEKLLKWFSDDREEAGKKYEIIRQGLLRFFRFKGCMNAETLVDKTFNRVAEKIDNLDKTRNVKEISLFVGFASNILLEHLKQKKIENKRMEDFALYQRNLADFDNEFAEKESECLHKCLTGLSISDRELFVEYYLCERNKKAEIRKQIVERLGCEMNALHVKILRLRGVLRKCIEKCVKKSL